MKFGVELVKDLEREIETLEEAIRDRQRRIADGWTDMDDCFVSQHCEERAISVARNKIALINDGGCAWFVEYATLDGTPINAKWCKSQYGYGSVLRAEMPDGSIVWTSAHTAKGLAAKGIKKIKCLRPAWYCFSSNGTGLWGAYSGQYVLFPSDWNYATGEDAPHAPIEIAEIDKED